MTEKKTTEMATGKDIPAEDETTAVATGGAKPAAKPKAAATKPEEPKPEKRVKRKLRYQGTLPELAIPGIGLVTRDADPKKPKTYEYEGTEAQFASLKAKGLVAI